MKNIEIPVMQLGERLLSESDRLWAASAIADLPVVVTADPDNNAHEFEVDGSTFRYGGQIVAGTRRFRVALANGATNEDLDWLRERVDEAKRGLLDGWTRDDKQQLHWTWSRQVDPVASRGYLLVLCDDPGCVYFASADPFHQGRSSTPQEAFFLHTAEYEACRNGYDIKIERASDELEWRVVVEAPVCELTSGQAAGMASDIQYAVGEARRLNG